MSDETQSAQQEPTGEAQADLEVDDEQAEEVKGGHGGGWRLGDKGPQTGSYHGPDRGPQGSGTWH